MNLYQDPEGMRGLIPEELNDSVEKLLSYAAVSADKSDILRENLRNFRRLKDKSSYTTETKHIREAVIPVFFEIYTAVLKRVISEKNSGPLYRMFLTFGYMDENLLQLEHIHQLYDLISHPTTSAEFTTYNSQTWLEQIYLCNKEPSVNEFGQDYNDVFREMKRNGKVTDRDKPAYDADKEGRLEHEINNLLKHGQRLCYGQVNGYFPILYSDLITGDLTKALLTPTRIADSVKKVLEVDYSAFHRETVYNHLEKGIKNEIIMKCVPPDFILMPTFGSRGVMWQELTGRVKSSHARFVLPIFTLENLDNLITEMIATFRWELSRSMTSYIRNNAHESSIVGEYSDYLQFYKKNRDLSPETKERIKNQIDKHRSNVTDVFISDYRTWINYESKGLLRLNKVAREIMFKYCPFSKPIRDNLERQPLFNPLVTKLANLRAKEIKAAEIRYRKLALSGESMDPELADHIEFLNM